MFNTHSMDFKGHDDGLAIFREADEVRTQQNGDETILFTDDGEDVSTFLKFRVDQ